MNLPLLQGDRGLAGERGMKGAKGDMGDSGVPGEVVRKQILFFTSPIFEDMLWLLVVEIRMSPHLLT